MEYKPVDVEVLESTPDGIKVKLPFLEVPVEMNHYFFQKRLECGYFKVREMKEHLKVKN